MLVLAAAHLLDSAFDICCKLNALESLRSGRLGKPNFHLLLRLAGRSDVEQALLDNVKEVVDQPPVLQVSGLGTYCMKVELESSRSGTMCMTNSHLHPPLAAPSRQPWTTVHPW